MQTPLPTSILLHRIKKEHDYRVTIVDSQPVEMVCCETATTATENSNETRRQQQQQQQLCKETTSSATTAVVSCCCSVCGQHEGRYTCPRCKIKYCSVACYRNHEGNGNANACTETFYENRVSQVLDLEVKDKKDATYRMLQRVHQQRRRQEEEDVASIDEGGMNREELLRILHLIEKGDETDELTRILDERPDIRASLHESIQRGDLQEWIVEPWHPWWLPNLIAREEETRGGIIEEISTEEEDDDENRIDVKEKTLDERLLRIPALSKMRSGKLPDLRFNLVDILYGIASTLRLYAGISNAMESSIDAADTLLCASLVLKEDTRWESVPASLASATTNESSQCRQINTKWNVLAQDVSILCSNVRFIGRALLEGADILRTAAVDAKKEGNSQAPSSFRKGRKKLEFYLSWYREQEETRLSSLSSEITRWVRDWQPSEEHNVIDSFQLNERRPMNPSSPIRLPTQNEDTNHGLLREVSVVRR